MRVQPAAAWRYAAVSCCLAWLLAACSINAPARVAPASYDLGGPVVKDEGKALIAATLLVPRIASPAWLDTTDIAYRLDYEDPNRLRAYAESRWAATPGMLLTEALRSRFARSADGVIGAAVGAQADYVLRVELEEFEQLFAAPDRSRVAAAARATLLDAQTRHIVAQDTFRVEQQSAPNAAGAAAALAESSSRLIENMLDWAAQKLKNSATRSTAKRSVR